MEIDPNKAIDFIAKRSIAAENSNASNFLFFETKDGYKFKTFEQLILDGIKQLESQDYKNSHTYLQNENMLSVFKGSENEQTGKLASQMFNGYTVAVEFDLPNQMDNSGLQSTLQQYDLVTKKLNIRQYQFDPNKYIFMNSSPDHFLTNTIIDKYKQTKNKSFLIPFSTYRDTVNNKKNFKYDVMLERFGYASAVSQYRTYIDAPGNSMLKVGDMIVLDAPLYSNIGDKNTVSSGNYLIAALKHSVTIGIETAYSCSLELLRGERGKYVAKEEGSK